ncbi:MAG: hypothetical protein ACP5E4_03400 [Candidatus Aenigmatarchaeota archaeon]
MGTSIIAAFGRLKSSGRNSKLKGIAPLMSTILIVGVLAAVTGIAYQWGMPMMQKNVGKTDLYAAETFLRELDNKIDEVSKSGGSEEIYFNIPGEITVDPVRDRVEFGLETSGSIYSIGGFICFTRNCDLDEGKWGDDSYSVIGAQVIQSEGNYALTRYSLTYRNLTANGITYVRDIATSYNATITGSENSRLLITKVGETRGNVTSTIIKIDLL